MQIRQTLAILCGVWCSIATLCQAATPLPPAAIEEATTAVVRIDMTRIDPTSSRAGLRDILGPGAAAADPALGLGQILLEAMNSAGLQSATLVWSAPKSDGDDPYYAIYLQLKSGANVDSIKKIFTDAWPDKEDAPAFDKSSGFLVAHLHDQPLHTKGSPERAKTFAEAFAAAGDGAIVMAVCPTPEIRKVANLIPTAGLPDRLAELVPYVASSKWATLAIGLGSKPGALLNLKLDNDKSAGEVVRLLTPPAKSKSATAPASAVAINDDPMLPWLMVSRVTQTASRVSLQLNTSALTRLIAFYRSLPQKKSQ